MGTSRATNARRRMLAVCVLLASLEWRHSFAIVKASHFNQEMFYFSQQITALADVLKMIARSKEANSLPTAIRSQVNVVYKKCEVLQDRVPKVQQQVGDKIDRAVLWLRNVEHKDDPGVNAAWMKRRLQLAEFEFDAMQSSLRDELTRTMDMQRALQKLQSDMIRFVSGKEKDKGTYETFALVLGGISLACMACAFPAAAASAAAAEAGAAGVAVVAAEGAAVVAAEELLVGSAVTGVGSMVTMAGADGCQQLIEFVNTRLEPVRMHSADVQALRQEVEDIGKEVAHVEKQMDLLFDACEEDLEDVQLLCGSCAQRLEEEAFALEVMSWMSRFADSPELEDKHSAAQCVEWLLAQRSLDAKFSLVLSGNPRAPKKVLAAAKRDAATLELQRLQSSGQRFLPNPAGIKGFVKRGVLAAFGSPYESPSGSWLPKGLKAFVGEGSLVEPVAPNSWHGDDYEPCNAEARFLKDPQRLRKATVRIDEIMSFEYMQHVGQVMANCLRVERRGGMSLVKYLSRAKSRDSSFWVMTITAEPEEDEEEAPVQHLLLMEVYNGLRVIHQAEGPHPRRWPRLDAWRWLEEWADQEKLRPDGPEGVTVGPYEAYDADMDRWDIRRCFLW
ncbi:unnamed protein product [Effrenium voratum]|nr:unnamed protein product [Effrenium voratum]